MSAIPPDIIGSVLQSGVARQAQSQGRDRIENDRTDGSRELTGRGGEEDILEIEETDGRTRVNADGGGQGSQGRYDGPSEEDAGDADDSAQSAGRDDAHSGGLDVTA